VPPTGAWPEPWQSRIGHRPGVHFGDDVGDLVLTTNNAYRKPADQDESLDAADDLDGTCPYRGLAAYSPADSRWFRGRNELTEAVVRGLADRVWGGGPLVVLGSSGSGKSSLLRASLLPAVRHGDLGVPGSSAWPAVVLTPGAQPVWALADGLRAFGRADQLARPDTTRAVIRAALAADDRLVIVVDQFEELFTQCTDETQRKAFIATLWALTAADPIAVIVLGLRSDFHGARTAYPELIGTLERALIVVGAMTTRELRSVITEPADLAGLALQAGLAEVLLRASAPIPATTTRLATTPAYSRSYHSRFSKRGGCGETACSPSMGTGRLAASN
jgi:hypothetical protein